ncbi:MAG: dihydroneopterin aldolase family protein [Candidatus Odinarchaeota archaeon]
MSSEDEAKRFFPQDLTDRDRAVFEAGVKIGAVYHQFIGAPIPREKKSLKILEAAIEESVKTQPWVKNVKVSLKPRIRRGAYSYDEISKNNITVWLNIKYNTVEVEAVLKYNEELKYPLAYIKNIKKF